MVDGIMTGGACSAMTIIPREGRSLVPGLAGIARFWLAGG